MDPSQAADGDHFSRRRALAALTVSLAGFAFWPPSHWFGARRDRLVPTRVSAKAKVLFSTYPIPHYLPHDYFMTWALANPASGLRTLAGEPVAEQLRLTAARRGNLDVHHPLVVFVAPYSGSIRLFGAPDERTVHVELPTANGAAKQALYCDGQWGPGRKGAREWQTYLSHSVVFDLEAYVVGLRGSRVTGISREELFRIAASIS